MGDSPRGRGWYHWRRSVFTGVGDGERAGDGGSDSDVSLSLSSGTRPPSACDVAMRRRASPGRSSRSGELVGERDATRMCTGGACAVLGDSASSEWYSRPWRIARRSSMHLRAMRAGIMRLSVRNRRS